MKHDAWIGIDPSYSGFAIVVLADHAGRLRPLNLLTDFTHKRWGTGGARLSAVHYHLHREFTSLAGTYRIRALAIEGYAPGAKFGREGAGELGGILRLTAHDILPHIAPLIVAPAAVKKFATGRGTAAKDDMKLAVYKKWAEEYTSHDLADAHTLARIAHAVTEGTHLAYERDIVAALTGKLTPSD